MPPEQLKSYQKGSEAQVFLYTMTEVEFLNYLNEINVVAPQGGYRDSPQKVWSKLYRFAGYPYTP